MMHITSDSPKRVGLGVSAPKPDHKQYQDVDAENAANALLIAAAPDLLAACRDGIKHLEAYLRSAPMPRGESDANYGDRMSPNPLLVKVAELIGRLEDAH